MATATAVAATAALATAAVVVAVIGLLPLGCGKNNRNCLFLKAVLQKKERSVWSKIIYDPKVSFTVFWFYSLISTHTMQT